MPLLAPSDVHLWLARPDRLTDPALRAACLALLSPDERERLDRFAFEARRHEHLATRALVRTVLSRYGPLAPAAWRFTAAPDGKPALDPAFDLQFNLSNAPALVACAVARAPVGVDAEPLARVEAVLGLAASVFTAAERRRLDALPAAARPDGALALWTLKEAYLKARGDGLRLPLHALEFELGPAGVTARFGPALADRPEAWSFRLLLHAGHRLAVAARRPARLRAWEVVPLGPGETALLEEGAAT